MLWHLFQLFVTQLITVFQITTDNREHFDDYYLPVGNTTSFCS